MNTIAMDMNTIIYRFVRLGYSYYIVRDFVLNYYSTKKTFEDNLEEFKYWFENIQKSGKILPKDDKILWSDIYG
jgi:hypothetical protein